MAGREEENKWPQLTDIRENIQSGRTAEILRITNRQWTVDGNVAFAVDDGT
jgi:hypothetical protein